MLSFLLATTLLLQPVRGCMKGFKYIPPDDASACVPCTRGAPSSRLLFSSAAPCCPDSNSLRNATGISFNHQAIGMFQDLIELLFATMIFTLIFLYNCIKRTLRHIRLWSDQHQDSWRSGRCRESVPLAVRDTQERQHLAQRWSDPHQL